MINWRDFPSLSALRTFEALGRLGNQSKAATELNVTQAAVSQQMRNLQKQIGITLFVKDGRGGELTREGERLHQNVSNGFQQIQSVLSELKAPQESLSVTMSPQFANYQFIPKLPEFWQAYPNIPLTFSASTQLIDLHAENTDFAIRFGRGDWKGLICERLETAQFSIFTSLALKMNEPSWLENFQQARWIISDDSPEIAQILKEIGVDTSAPQHLRVSTVDQARAALLSGIGLSAQKRSWLKHEIDHGIVDEIKPLPNPNGYGYFLVYPSPYLSENAQKFRDWIKKITRA